MARSLKPMRNQNPMEDPWTSAPGIGSSFVAPTIEVCPYDKSHRLRTQRMVKHLLKCRKAYIQKYKQGNEIPLTLICKYNMKHIVYVPEIHYHEDRCKDADFVPTYLLHTEPFKDCSGYDPSFEILEPTQAELDKLYEGTYIDTFIGSESHGMPVPLSEVGKVSAACKNFGESEECDDTPSVKSLEEEDDAAATSGVGSSLIGLAFEVCPYNENHLVTRQNMFGGHMMECRKNYVQKCIEEGEIPLTLKCKYNEKHIVYAPEIQYHEDRCRKGDFVPTYLVNSEPLKDCSRFDSVLQAGLEKFHVGCYLPVTLFDLKKLIAKYENFEEGCYRVPEESQDEKEEAATSTSAEEESAGAGATGYEIDSRGSPTPGPCSKRRSTSVDQDDEDSEEEYWKNYGNESEPSFNYILNAPNPTKPMFMYPSGLSKREKEEYMKSNTKWVQDLGIRRPVQVTVVRTDTKELSPTKEPGQKKVEEERPVDKKAKAGEEHQVPKNDDDAYFEEDEEYDDDDEEDFDDNVFVLVGNSLQKKKVVKRE